MVTNPSLTQDARRRSDAPVITDLVTRVRNGDRQAWDALAERYAPLIWSICRRRQLSGADAEDAAQSAWLKLIGQLDRIRDPAALPGWLGHHDSAGMQPHPARSAGTIRCRVRVGRRGHPGRARPDSRAGMAQGRAPRGLAPGGRAPAPLLPAVDRPPPPGPSRALR
jgi:hypothetical protein